MLSERRYITRDLWILFQEFTILRYLLSTDNNTQLGFAWVEVTGSPARLQQLYTKEAQPLHPLQPKLKFTQFLRLFSLACAQNSNVTIYTDSQDAIDTYYRISNKLTSIRRLLKMNNHIVRRLLSHLISAINITLSLIKIKGHSNDTFNDLAERRSRISSDWN